MAYVFSDDTSIVQNVSGRHLKSHQVKKVIIPSRSARKACLRGRGESPFLERENSQVTFENFPLRRTHTN